MSVASVCGARSTRLERIGDRQEVVAVVVVRGLLRSYLASAPSSNVMERGARTRMEGCGEVLGAIGWKPYPLSRSSTFPRRRTSLSRSVSEVRVLVGRLCFFF